MSRDILMTTIANLLVKQQSGHKKS